MARACKLCDLLPNRSLEVALLTESSRKIAGRFDIGRTTVNKHRNGCMKMSVPQSQARAMDDTEAQEVTWQGQTGELKTGILDNDIMGKSHEEILIEFGHDPSKVEISTVLWEKHKQYWSRDMEQMLWKHSYSFGIVRKQEQLEAESIDAVELLKSIADDEALRNRGTTKYMGMGLNPSTFVLDWADWQFAKLEGGGTDGLIKRLNHAFDKAVERIEELRYIGRELDELVIIGGGDMVEGCVIYPNQSYEIDGNRREQIRGTVAMILHGLAKLAPMFETVRVVVVPGNHGEHRIAGNRTTIGDNDDLLVFEMAAVACENDPRFAHVKFEIAEKEISMATVVRGWTYGITHGDVFGKGSGTGVRNKVFNWFKTMAANRHSVGAADVLVTHHFHHDAMEDWGNTLWVQNPTMDGGSHYFKEFSGHDTKPGMNSWVVTTSERLQDKQVLR